MKKLIIIMLLACSPIWAQAEYERIKLTENTVSTSTTKINTQEADGEINYINALNLPTPTATTNELDLKTTLSAGAFSGFEVTDNGNGTINVGSGIAYLRSTNDPYAPLIKYPIAAYNNIPLADNTTNYVVVSYNGGSPALVLNTTGAGIDTQTTSIATVAARVGTTVHYISLVGSNADPNAKLRIRYLVSEPITRGSGLIISSTGLKLITTSGSVFSGLLRFNVPDFNTNTGSTFTRVYNTGGSTWNRLTSQTDINNTQYNNAGTLTTLGVNKYRTDYVYMLINNPNKLYVIMGDVEYGSLLAAQAAPKPSSVPVELQTLGVLIGRVCVKKDDTVLDIASPFSTVFQASGVPNHNDLAGLQGGTAGEFNHLTNAQVALVNVAEQTTNKTNSYTVSSTTTYPNTKALVDGLATKQNTLTNPVTGTGTTNTISKWTGTNTQGNASFTDNGIVVTFPTDIIVNAQTIGKGAGNLATNTVHGNQVNSANLTGDGNTIMGYQALINSSASNDNVVLGKWAARRIGDSTTPLTALNSSVVIGFSAYPLNDSDTNEIIIGAAGRGLGSNTSVIGNSSTTQTWLGGKLTVGKTTNDGVNDIQANGTVSSGNTTLGTSQPTANNQLTRKDYVDTADALKANLASPAFTGTPTAPTAAAGTNTTQVATTAFVQSGFVPQIKITTTTSITTATVGSVSGLGQQGRNVVLDNGSNVINLTVNGTDGFCASYLKHGTGNVTFVQGSGRTLIQVDGTAVLSGAVGSTATISSVGTTDYLMISNK